jgi:hypothetical protein
MYISKLKVLVIFVIVITILYKSNIESKITEDINTFSLRRVIYTNQELPSFPNDYDTVEYAKMYLQNFLNVLQNDINADISKYVESDYYKENIENNKANFIKDMKKNIIMASPIGNYQDIGYITEYVNKDGYKTIAYDVLVMEKGLDYPRGFDSLKERNNEDQSKMMDIHVIEYSPYNFKVIFPDKTIVTEEF